MTAVAIDASRRPPLAPLLILLTVGLGLAASQISPYEPAEEPTAATSTGLTASGQPDSGPPYPNHYPEHLEAEIASAERVGVEPISPAHPRFVQLVNQGRIKYVVLESGELLVGPHTAKGIEISHAVLSRGRAVLTAGEAQIAAHGGRYIGLEIAPWSGHFRPSAESVRLAHAAFKRFGVQF